MHSGNSKYTGLLDLDEQLKMMWCSACIATVHVDKDVQCTIQTVTAEIATFVDQDPTAAPVWETLEVLSTLLLQTFLLPCMNVHSSTCPEGAQ